jgi:arylsulfatase
MVFTHGGLTGGYGIYLRDGRAHFVDNMLAIDRFTILPEALPKGKVTLAVNVAYKGKPA